MNARDPTDPNNLDAYDGIACENHAHDVGGGSPTASPPPERDPDGGVPTS
jgi:hypothetical protein